MTIEQKTFIISQLFKDWEYFAEEERSMIKAIADDLDEGDLVLNLLDQFDINTLEYDFVK